MVEAGATVEITDRGRPVAVLAPLPDSGVLNRLRASGDLVPAEASYADLDEALALPVGEEAPSSVLERLRADER